MTPKELWIQALRSGEYEQGIDYLNYRGKLCCLGVACEVFIKQGGTLSRSTNENGVIEYHGLPTSMRTSLELPTAVQAWLNLNTPLGDFPEDFPGESLAALNDDGRTFEDIANVIETTPELFA
mgnify:CR=1 FL=1